MSKTILTVKSNGSIRVEGDFELRDSDGNPFDLGGREVIALCRCGKTLTPPFCDGAHKGQFDAPSFAYSLPPKSNA
jgi:CDGSH-type Zn-finger protein